MTETSKMNDNALPNSEDKISGRKNKSGIIAAYFMSLLSKVTNFEHISQFKLVKDPNSKKVNDLSIKRTVAVTVNDNLLSFRDADKKFELNVNLWKMATN